jgi:DNA-binding protein H-NS
MPRTISLKSIQAQIQALEAKAEKLKHAEKPGMKQLRALIGKYKLKRADIDLVLKKGGANLKDKAVTRGTKLKPKYQNPKNHAETWAGRGLKPKWLVGMIKQGKKVEEFAI